MNALRCMPSRAWMMFVMLAKLCVPIAAAQSASFSSASGEEVETSLGLERAQRQRVQRGLRALGFNPGAPDGLFGPRTRQPSASGNCRKANRRRRIWTRVRRTYCCKQARQRQPRHKM